MALVTGVQGYITDARPLFDRRDRDGVRSGATDLRPPPQINRAVALVNLDRYRGTDRGESGTAAGRTGRHGDPAGAGARRPGPAALRNGAMGRCAGRGGEPAREPERTRRGLHRSRHRRRDRLPSRRDRRGPAPPRRGRPARHPDRAPADRPAGRGPQPGPRAGRRPAGGARRADRGVRRQCRELEETEDLLADAVRLAAGTGDLDTARTLAGHADTLAAESEIPHRQANALYCRGLLDYDAPRLLTAAQLYEEAGLRCSGPRPWRRPPGTSSTPTTASRRGPPLPPPSRSTTRWTRRRTRPGSRPRSGPTASGAGRTPSTGGRRAAGTALRRPRSRSPRSWRRDCPTRRSRPGCCYPAGPLARTSPTSSRSSTSTRGSTSPGNRPCAPSRRGNAAGKRGDPARKQHPLEPRGRGAGSRGIRWEL